VIIVLGVLITRGSLPFRVVRVTRAGS
jgi:hypothetical protein